MVASAARRRAPFTGLRPIDIRRDLRLIADLIVEAFEDDMDPAGQRAVRQMRMAGRWAFLFGWMDRIAPPGEGMAPGFVWIEDDRVVGNISVRRIGSFGRGWMIGNVAVATGWRRRGIARSLMTAAIDLARQRRGEWVALQVRSDGEVAKKLYRSLGFESVGETIQYLRPPGKAAAAPQAPDTFGLRLGRAADASRIFDLAQAAIPEALRWAEPLRRDDFWMGFDRAVGNRLTGRHEAWWTAETTLGLAGAAHLDIPRPPYEGRLRVWVAPPYQGQYEDRLVRTALASVANAHLRPIAASLPLAHTAACDALASAGFEEHRRLTHMRLDLR